LMGLFRSDRTRSTLASDRAFDAKVYIPSVRLQVQRPREGGVDGRRDVVPGSTAYPIPHTSGTSQIEAIYRNQRRRRKLCLDHRARQKHRARVVPEGQELIANRSYDEFLSDRGVPVHRDYPGAETALARIDAIQALDLLEARDALILGGDVYRIDGQELKSTWDSWSVERREDEGEQAFRARSRVAARKFIQSCRIEEEGIFFVFVLAAPGFTPDGKVPTLMSERK